MNLKRPSFTGIANTSSMKHPRIELFEDLGSIFNHQKLKAKLDDSCDYLSGYLDSQLDSQAWVARISPPTTRQVQHSSHDTTSGWDNQYHEREPGLRQIVGEVTVKAEHEKDEPGSQTMQLVNNDTEAILDLTTRLLDAENVNKKLRKELDSVKAQINQHCQSKPLQSSGTSVKQLKEKGHMARLAHDRLKGEVEQLRKALKGEEERRVAAEAERDILEGERNAVQGELTELREVVSMFRDKVLEIRITK
uniref:Uncharacterized protein n=1 Tax=Moniliophthora roreri TaxID=221103 RepID=A0A0W0FJV4_MONRR